MKIVHKKNTITIDGDGTIVFSKTKYGVLVKGDSSKKGSPVNLDMRNWSIFGGGEFKYTFISRLKLFFRWAIVLWKFVWEKNDNFPVLPSD